MRSVADRSTGKLTLMFQLPKEYIIRGRLDVAFGREQVWAIGFSFGGVFYFEWLANV